MLAVDDVAFSPQLLDFVIAARTDPPDIQVMCFVVAVVVIRFDKRPPVLPLSRAPAAALALLWSIDLTGVEGSTQRGARLFFLWELVTNCARVGPSRVKIRAVELSWPERIDDIALLQRARYLAIVFPLGSKPFLHASGNHSELGTDLGQSHTTAKQIDHIVSIVVELTGAGREIPQSRITWHLPPPLNTIPRTSYEVQWMSSQHWPNFAVLSRGTRSDAAPRMFRSMTSLIS